MADDDWQCAYCDGESGCPRASDGSPRCAASQCKVAHTAARAAARTLRPVVAPCVPHAAPTTCFKIKEVLGVSFCMERMQEEESRCGRERSDEELCYQLRGKFGKSRHDARGRRQHGASDEVGQVARAGGEH